MSETQVEKKLKKSNFSPVDTAVAMASFVVLYWVLSSILVIMGTGLFVQILSHLVIEGIFFLSVIIASKSGNVEFVSATKMNSRPNYKTFLIALAISVVTLLAFSSLTNVFMITIEKLGYKPSDDIAIPNIGYYFMYVILMCAIPAYMEDFMFRGCVLNGLTKINKHFAVVASAILFTLMHGSPDQTVHQLILGIILGYVVVYSSSLWPAVFIHFINNFIALTIGFIQGPSQQIDVSTISWSEVGKSFAIALALAAVGTVIVVFCILGIKKIENKPQAKKEEVQGAENEGKKDKDKKETKSKKDEKLALTIILYAASVALMLTEWIVRLIA